MQTLAGMLTEKIISNMKIYSSEIKLVIASYSNKQRNKQTHDCYLGMTVLQLIGK